MSFCLTEKFMRTKPMSLGHQWCIQDQAEYLKCTQQALSKYLLNELINEKEEEAEFHISIRTRRQGIRRRLQRSCAERLDRVDSFPHEKKKRVRIWIYFYVTALASKYFRLFVTVLFFWSFNITLTSKLFVKPWAPDFDKWRFPSPFIFP